MLVRPISGVGVGGFLFRRWDSLMPYDPDGSRTASLPTKILPTKIARLELPGKFPMGRGIPPL